MPQLEFKPSARPQLTENAIDKRGSDCSGSSGASNRVLTIGNTSTTTGFIIFVNGTMLHPTHDYTASNLSASSTITFLNLLNDTAYIDGFYFT